MAYDIGPRIGIDGEAEFRAQISKVNTSIRTLGTEMQVVTSAFAGQERSTEALIAQNNVLSRTVTALEDKLSQQKDMLARCAHEYGENSEETLKWQQAVNQTQAELNRANAQIDANEQALRDNGETVVDTAEKHEGAMSKIGAAAKAGLGAAAEALKAVGTVAIAAVGAATTAVAGLVKESVAGYAEYEQLVGGVETLFGTGGKSMQEFAEEQGKTVEEIRKTYQDLANAESKVLSNANNAYKTAGLSANEYMETVTSFSAALISSLGGDTAKAASVADKAIVDMADNANKMGSSMESIQNAYQGFAKQNYTMLDNLKLGYGGTKEEMQRLLADAEKISGQKFDLSSYADVVEAIHVVQTEMGITGTTAKEASETIQGSLAATAAAWQNLVAGLSNGEIELDALINDVVDSAITAFGNILPVVLMVLESIGTAIQDFAPVLAETLPTLIEDVLPSMLEAGVSLVVALVSGLGSALPSIVTAIGQVVGLLISGLESALPKIKEEGPGAIKSFTSGVTQALPEILTTAGSIITQLIEGLTANLPAVVDSAASILSSLVSGIAAQLPTLIPAALDMILTLATSLISNVDTLADSAIDLLTGLAGGLISSIPIIAKKAPDIVGGLVNAIVENVPKMLTAAISLLQNLATGIIDNLPELGNAAGEIVGKIASGIEELWNRLLEIGGNIVKGLWQGIQDKIDWFTEKITGFLDGIVSSVLELLGIASPSKVFAGIGENMALGLGKGWDREIGGIRRDIENGVDFSGLDPKVNMPGLTLGVERPNYQDLFAGVVNGMQTVAAGNEFPQSATIILQAGDGMTLARWILPDLRAAMRDDPEPV